MRPAKAPTWIDRLDAESQEGIHEVRKRFQAGGYGAASAASVARAIREEAAEKHWHVVSEKEIAEWLRK